MKTKTVKKQRFDPVQISIEVNPPDIPLTAFLSLFKSDETGWKIGPDKSGQAARVKKGTAG